MDVLMRLFARRFGMTDDVKEVMRRRIWLPSSEYAARFNARWHPFEPKTKCRIDAPYTLGASSRELKHKIDKYYPESGVLELPDALMIGNHGWVFSKEGIFLPYHSWYGRHVDEMCNYPMDIDAKICIEGKVLSLASDFCTRGYGHFVTDSLPRLHIYKECGFDIDDVDFIVCPKPLPGNGQRLFDALDLPKEKLIWANDIDCAKIEQLLVPTFPGMRRTYPGWVTQFLRDKFTSNDIRPTRKLYVTRRGYTRNPENSSEVEALFEEYGFEIYDPTSNPHAHLDFAEAIFVAGASGSNLTGIAFASEQCKVLELMPSDHVYPYYYSLATSAGKKYGYLLCKSLQERPPNSWGPSHSNFFVDMVELENGLSDWCRSDVNG
jgi:hypothetical protein